jgi:iron(III) transport system substrate-binding protein
MSDVLVIAYPPSHIPVETPMKPTLLAAAAAIALPCALATTPAHAQQSVSAICSTDRSWCDQAAKEFTAATGIRVAQVHKPTGEALAQLRAEASNPRTDIWWGGTGDPFLQGAEIGLLEPYRPAYINDLHAWSVRQYASSGNMVGGFYTGPITFGVNTELLKKKKLPEPQCWADLAKPIYKGEIESSNPASSGGAYTILAGLVQLMGEEPAFDYMKALHKNITQYTRSSQAQAPNLAKGEATIAISFLHGWLPYIEQKHPIKSIAPCEGTSYEIGGIALVKGSRNLEAGRRYYDWLMSPEGQGAGGRASSLQTPANKKTVLDKRIPNTDSMRLVKYDFEKYGKAAERRRLVGRWEKEVAAAAK